MCATKSTEQAKKDRSLIDAGIKLCEIKDRLAEALAERDARTLEMAAEICIDLGDDSSDLDSRTLTACARELRAKADELAKACALPPKSERRV